MGDIEHLFEPRGVAVIGASNSPGKIGYKILHNILECGYKGKVYPVNPKGGEILGCKAYRKAEDIEGPVDVAIISVPAKFALEAVEDCARKGVKYIPLITSGFSEIGEIELEMEIVKTAKQAGMRILGPNIFGIYSSRSSLNGTFGPKDIKPGHVAIITQSGALGIAMIGKTAVENIGLSTMVSVGNKCDIDESDLLDYLIEDEQTKVIMMYIEGVSKGSRFISTLKRATKVKPVVVIKSGRSERGAQAAASHTGSLAGSDDIFDSVMKQCGVLRAESIKTAFNWCKFLANAPEPPGRNVIIITNGGGIGVMATDACEKFGIHLYDDPEATKRIFGPVTPDFGSTKNPVDLTGGASSEDYIGALKAAATNPDIHGAIGLYCETALFDAKGLTSAIRQSHEMFAHNGKPLVFSSLGGKTIQDGIDELGKEGVPVFEDVYEAVECLGAVFRTKEHKKKMESFYPEILTNSTIITETIGGAMYDGRNFLLADEAKKLLESSGIQMPKSMVAKDLAQAVSAAEDIGYPVVMKVVSRDILHKSDAGGVVLDLQNRNEVIDAWEGIMMSCKRYDPSTRITGIEVCEMVKKGVETIVGARRDPSFGPIVMFGMGGIYVEVLKDVAFRALPLTRAEAIGLIKETKAYPLLLGVRGEDKKDIDTVVETILQVGALLQSTSLITDIEINPLVVYDQGQGGRAVDGRILLSSKEVKE